MESKRFEQLENKLRDQHSFVDTETKRKIDEHLSNFHHQITDADLQNAKSDHSLFQKKIDNEQRLNIA